MYYLKGYMHTNIHMIKYAQNYTHLKSIILDKTSLHHSFLSPLGCVSVSVCVCERETE